MSRAASSARRPAKTGRTKGRGKAYLPDRLVGILLAIGDVLMIVMGGALGTLGILGNRKSVDRLTLLFAALFLVLGVLQLVVHVGIFRSRRRAFIAAAFLSVLSLNGSSVGGHLVLPVGLFAFVYAILRLIPAFGPKPA